MHAMHACDGPHKNRFNNRLPDGDNPPEGALPGVPPAKYIRGFIPMSKHNYSRCGMHLALVMGSVVSVAADAATYYVDPAGKDSNSGSQSSPFKTIQKAADSVRPGDTVLVNPGVYSSTRWTIVDLYKGGTSSQWVTFKSRLKGQAKLANSPSARYGFSFEPDAHYIRIQDFDMSGMATVGVAVWSPNHDIVISGNHFHNIGRVCTDTQYGSGGLYIQGTNVVIEDNRMHDLGRFGPDENGCQPKTWYYMNHDHGVYVDGGTNITIRNNQFHTIEHGWAIQVYSGGGKPTVGLTVEGNNFAFPNPYRDGHITLSAPGVQNAVIRQNSFFHPNRSALLLESDASFKNVTVERNMTFPAPISMSSPAGVSFLSNY